MSRKLKSKPTFSLLLSHLFCDKKRGQRGFSLAEIMVAAGMLGVLSLGVSQLMQNSAKTEKRLSQQVNLITLDSQIFDALHDTTSCERTLGITDGTAPNASTPGGSFVALPTNAIYRGNNPEAGADKTKWNIAVQTYDGADAGIYGSGSNTVYVKAIEYAGLLKDNVDTKYGESSNYSATERTEIPGTADFWGTIVLHVDFRRGNPASYESLTEDAQIEKAKRSLYGQYKVPRFYKLNVRVNAANQIVSCYAYDEIMSDTYCSLLDGHLDMATGRCTNIKIRTSPFKAAEATPDLWSMTAYTVDGQDGNALIQGGFQVGGAISDAPPAVGNAYIQGDTQDDGNIFIGKDASTISPGLPPPPVAEAEQLGYLFVERDILGGRDVQVNAQLRSEKEALFKGKVNIGPDTIDTSPDYIFKLKADELVASPGEAERVTFYTSSVDQSKVEINSSFSSRGIIQLNDSLTEPFKILEESNMVFRVNQTGRVDFYNGNGGGKFTTIVRNSGRIDIMDGSNNDNQSHTLVKIGDGSFGSNYRPIKVYNQPVQLSDMKFGDLEEVANELPTKKWVKKYVFGSYDDAKINQVLDSLLEYAQHHELELIRKDLCQDTYMRWMKDKDDPPVAPHRCTYIAGTCRCNPTNCSSDSLSGDVEICKDIFLSRRLTADTVLAKQLVHSQFDVTADREMRAPIIKGSNFVKGGKVFAGNIASSVPSGWVGAAGGVRANSKVCVNSTSGNCYTRFGKFMCPWQRVMVGIAYGQPVCAKVGP